MLSCEVISLAKAVPLMIKPAARWSRSW